MELASLALTRPEGRGIKPLLAPRLGNVKVTLRSTFTFRSLYVANKGVGVDKSYKIYIVIAVSLKLLDISYKNFYNNK